MTNPVRNCLACGGIDDHPRHVVVLPDGSDSAFHYDCHARLNPPCESCTELSTGAGGVTGDDFRAHLLSQTPKDAE